MSWIVTVAGETTALVSPSAAGFLAIVLLLIQTPAALILLSRLLKGPGRRPPINPQPPTLEQLGAVSVVVPTLNE